MFSQEAINLLNDILELFAQTGKIPIAMYEYDTKGDIIETVRSSEILFPQHCKLVWNINSGEGRKRCNENMCLRASEAIKTQKPLELLCHAGLSNITEPILIDNKVVAAIQYGAFLSPQISVDERIAQHNVAMKSLSVQESEANEIKKLLLQDVPTRSHEELTQLQQILSPILKGIITSYIVQMERNLDAQRAANHELQLKLQAILAEAENLLTENSANPKFSEPLNEIIGATEACGLVMHSLTRGDYLPQEYIFQPHDLRDFIDDAINLCLAEAKKKEIEIIVDLQPQDGRINIYLSQAHFKQAIGNLVQNAIKYSYRTTHQSNQRYIKIMGRLLKGGYEIVVSNYGVGIELDEYDSIFRTGYKGRLTRAEYRTGAGQGLAITQQIILKHKGTISVNSEPKGEVDESGIRPYLTRFIVWLPLKQEQSTGVR